ASFKPVQRGKPEPAILNLGDIPEGGFVQGVYAAYPFYAFNRKTGIECISLKCTHLGCLVKWNEAEEKFKCPCHDGWFDKSGVNKGGPPPAPLEQLPYKVAGDKLIVGGE
ncbi:MAG: ubiquinol-cytochrome c reductase iron-sulfur subunit, partial [Geobacter sp.]|nr:ubiquinol-cytochrome c reductase iron-sulfur subunit [Geobacter sp.]